VTPVSVGTVMVRARASMGVGVGVKCSDINTIEVTLPGPWWQAAGGNVISNGDIASDIEPAGTDFILPGEAGSPGLVLYSGSTLNTGNGNVNWRAKSDFSFEDEITYEYLINRVPSGAIVAELSGSVSGGDINSAANPSHGNFAWIKASGDLTINGNATITPKVILFVDGDLNVNGNINLASSDFFLAIVSGDINIDPTVTSLKGIFFADWSFSTGSGSNPLSVYGNVTTLSGVYLARDLGALNPTDPAEVFEFAPEIYLNYPASLTPNKMVWVEVAP